MRAAVVVLCAILFAAVYVSALESVEPAGIIPYEVPEFVNQDAAPDAVPSLRFRALKRKVQLQKNFWDDLKGWVVHTAVDTAEALEKFIEPILKSLIDHLKGLVGTWTFNSKKDAYNSAVKAAKTECKRKPDKSFVNPAKCAAAIQHLNSARRALHEQGIGWKIYNFVKGGIATLKKEAVKLLGAAGQAAKWVFPHVMIVGGTGAVAGIGAGIERVYDFTTHEIGVGTLAALGVGTGSVQIGGDVHLAVVFKNHENRKSMVEWYPGTGVCFSVGGEIDLEAGVGAAGAACYDVKLDEGKKELVKDKDAINEKPTGFELRPITISIALTASVGLKIPGFEPDLNLIAQCTNLNSIKCYNPTRDFLVELAKESLLQPMLGPIAIGLTLIHYFANRDWHAKENMIWCRNRETEVKPGQGGCSHVRDILFPGKK